MSDDKDKKDKAGKILLANESVEKDRDKAPPRPDK